MFNWFDLMRQAQTSAALDAIARQFNLSGVPVRYIGTSPTTSPSGPWLPSCQPSPWGFSMPCHRAIRPVCFNP